MLSPERAEILGESGCAFFWRAKRATAAGDYEEGHSLAKQAIVYLNTALKSESQAHKPEHRLLMKLVSPVQEKAS